MLQIIVVYGIINLGHHGRRVDIDYGSVVKRLRHRPFTAVTRVRFPSESLIYADVAQLAEQLICNQQVIGSSPIIGLVLTGLKDFGPLAQLVRAIGS